MVQVDYQSPDFAMLAMLRKNAYVFAAAKDFQMAKAITQQLIGPDGKLRSFAEFKTAAASIIGDHQTWLKTEYDTAVSSARMAAKWADIQATKEMFPLLQFDAVLDEHTTELCSSLDGVIRPVDDAFWQEYFPPNHWNCRSSVRKLRRGEITPTDKIHPSDKIPDLFKVNLPENSLAFPDTHPYYKGAEKISEQEGMKALRKHQMEAAGKLVVETEKQVKRSELSAPITFSKKGLKEAFNQPHNQYDLKNALLSKIDLVLSKAKYMGKTLPKPENAAHELYAHIFEVKLNGKLSYAIVKEYKDGTIKFYSLSDKPNVLDYLIK